MTKQAAQKFARVTRRFDASAERVFDAWIDPAMASRWLFTTANSESHSTELDTRVGGRWTIVDRRDGVDYTAIGEYVEIDRPTRLVFSFGMPQFSSGFDRVIVEIAPDGDGCILTLTQQSPAPTGYESQTEDGWREMFDALAGSLGSSADAYGVATGHRTVRFDRILPGPVERVWRYLIDNELRARWLAGGTIEPAVGGKVELFFRHTDLSPTKVAPPERYAATADGVWMRGHVTYFDPPWRLSLTWGEAISDAEVTFELAPRGEATLLTVVHDRLADRAEMANVCAGWHTHLAILSDEAAGRTPRPFWSLWAGVEDEYLRRLPKD